MTLGIVPNIYKPDVSSIILKIVEEIKKHNLQFILADYVSQLEITSHSELNDAKYFSLEEIGKNCDIVISIGGDGTMLNSAYAVRNSSTPLLGVNYGKLGFLAEFDLENFVEFLNEVKNKNIIVEERISLEGCTSHLKEKLFAINDLVIDKGPWQKMIEITIKVDDEYVTTFLADGIIIATPTGSTGYSLSTGGPIVSPKADVITLSPIAPHTLTMRPLVVSSSQKITISVNSPFDKIQVSSDGQRVNTLDLPTEIEIRKSDKPVKLVHLSKNNYFEILRTKLFWGLDIRKPNNGKV